LFRRIKDENGELWVTGKELSTHLGYKEEDAVSRIYNRHKSFFIDGRDTVDIKLMSTDGKEYDTRIFSVNCFHFESSCITSVKEKLFMAIVDNMNYIVIRYGKHLLTGNRKNLNRPIYHKNGLPQRTAT
jgi:hypothetical protein